MSTFVCSIEGPDFSGKSTISNLLVEELRRRLPDSIIKRTNVPSNMVTGAFIKVLRNSKDDVSDEVFALAYAADHLHHCRNFIDKLRKSKDRYVVVQERSMLSTLIYQSIMGRVDRKWLEAINKYNENIPDLQIILNIGVEELLKRKRVENRDFDKFETEEKIRQQVEIYSKLPPDLAKKYNVVYVDAKGDVNSVVKECADVILKKLK